MVSARILPTLASALALAACAHTSKPPTDIAAHPQEAFWQALSSHCGRAYDGRLASNDARDANFPQRRLVAHWAQCDEERIAIAFHAMHFGAADEPVWDRSRTWIVTRQGTGVGTRFTLKHDHRHADGEADAVTFYGGTSADTGGVRDQDFPVDDESIALFSREGLDASLTNVWRIEVDPAGMPEAAFAYQLTRRNDPTRLFRVEFDASAPVEPPPPAWGW